MGTESARSSDRIYVELPIIVRGIDATGREFEENTRTLVLSRSGAKILSQRALLPQQKLRIRCLKTGLETEVRVAGPIRGEEEGCHYGVELSHPEVNLWGIDFPLLTGAENAASRVLLECTRCRSQEVAHLDVFELEVLLANECLIRACRRCKEVSLWMPPVLGGEPLPASRVIPTPRHPWHERKEVRVSLKIQACIRHPVYGDELVLTENVSRGGFRFRSRKDYAVGTLFEAAIPYASGAANIFAPARIVYQENQPLEGLRAYGAAYVPAQMAASLTGMRISPAG